MKVLVVDDMVSMRHVMLHMLRSLGHTDIDEAADGLQALGLLNKKSYDLLITDYHMPKIDGRQLLKSIRSNKDLVDLPVLMVSCEDEKSRIKAIIACDVTDFIVKPFSLQTLEIKIKKIEKQFPPKISII
ncbi:response regulator [Cognaticolwellia mytili]|uniref:response regulator n=1 Tax=Cognaticolwellia mytili TaxID=1888913 RepID=UPI000A1718A2|nr:response regulator [Cognaticolwellia mytili]